MPCVCGSMCLQPQALEKLNPTKQSLFLRKRRSVFYPRSHHPLPSLVQRFAFHVLVSFLLLKSQVVPEEERMDSDTSYSPRPPCATWRLFRDSLKPLSITTQLCPLPYDVRVVLLQQETEFVHPSFCEWTLELVL